MAPRPLCSTSVSAAATLGLLGCGLSVAIAPQQAMAAGQAVSGLTSLDFDTVRLDRHRGTVRMLRGPSDLAAYAAQGHPEDAARRFARDHGRSLGLADTSALAVASSHVDVLGHTRVDFSQHDGGLRVFGASLRVHFDASGSLLAAQSSLVSPLDLAADADISATEAGAHATAHAAAISGAAVSVRSTELLVFDIGLLDKRGPRPVLAYAVELRGPKHASTVFVSASRGEVLLVNSHIHDELQRVAYEGDYGPSFEVWQETDGVYAGGDAEVQALIDYTQDTYTLFANVSMGEYLSFDGDSAPMEGVVDAPLECPNAQWDGTSTNYCPGLVTDDVVAHEWAHAYTQETQALVYAYQPGALNESYSDIFGEAVDLLNGEGLDEPGGTRVSGDCSGGGDSVRWLIGEETQGLGGAIRDMWSPGCFGHPAQVGDGDYQCTGDSFFDNGGVHINSGVPNHAFAVLVDGGLENGVTIPSIGMTRALAIYWRAMSTYQTQVSGFAEHADALTAACEDLRMAGTVLPDPLTGAPTPEVVRAEDCAAVLQAIELTGLDADAPCGSGTLLDTAAPPRTCSAGEEPAVVFEEHFDTDLGAWQVDHIGVRNTFTPRDWEHATALPSGRAGAAAFATNDLLFGNTVDDDQSGVLRLTSPSFERPAEGSAFIVSFRHWIASEPGQDGGNLSLSTNAGTPQPIPSAAFVFNGYNTTLEPSNNPLAGEPAFSGSDVGLATGSWVTSIVDLTELTEPGDTMVLRFDFGMDTSNGLFGWYVDDVVVEACGADLETSGDNTGTDGDDTDTTTTEDSGRDPTAALDSSSGGDVGGTAGPDSGGTTGPADPTSSETGDTESQASGEGNSGCACSSGRTPPGRGAAGLAILGLLGLVLHRRDPAPARHR